MATRVADRLEVVRRRTFVGRAADLELFAHTLAQDELPFLLLHVSGPGGVGKSSLLRRFEQIAAEAGVRCSLVDARTLPADPAAVAAALVPDDEPDGRGVLLVDTYELLRPLDDWIRTTVLPRLHADTLVVIAGQDPPAPAWRTDEGWGPLMRQLPLRNLSPGESTAYLSARGVPPSLHADAVRFTHGHPLALALVGEVLERTGSFDPRGSPDVLGVLLERLLTAAPSPLHAQALEAAAQVRVLTEPLLAAMVPDADVRAVFAWMRGLPIVQAGPHGLVLHDLARDVLAADLRWRDAARHVELHERARRHYLGALQDADPAVQSVLLLDLIYLHDDLRRFLRPPEQAAPGHRVEALSPGDSTAAAQIRDAVAAHEGPQSGELAAHWLARAPGAWLVVRGPGGHVEGALCLLGLEQADAEDERRDPAVASCRCQLASMPPLRPGERATLVRFWLAREDYQGVSAVQSLILTELARHFLLSPGLAVSLLPFADPGAWAAFCAYTDQQPMPAADFEVGGRCYAVFGHDWRAVPAAALVALLTQREVAAAPLDVPAPRRDEPLLVLSEQDFVDAVRAVLRDLTRPDRLRHSPLLRSRVVTARVPDGAKVADRVAALQEAVRAAAASVQASPRDARGYRAVHRAYLAPASTLERAAESLGLPSSTFRRHLAQGVGRVCDLLWREELGER